MGVLLKCNSKAFLKIHEYPSADDFQGKKRLQGVWTSWFVAKRFTVADFCTLEAMFTTTEENEVALSLFCDFGIFSQDQFCLQIEVNLWRKEEGKYFRKLYVPAS